MTKRGGFDGRVMGIEVQGKSRIGRLGRWLNSVRADLRERDCRRRKCFTKQHEGITHRPHIKRSKDDEKEQKLHRYSDR